MLESARNYVIEQFQSMPPASAQASFDKFCQSGLIETPLWGDYRFQSGKVWSEDLSPSVHRYFHSWNFMSSWITLALENESAREKVATIATLWISAFSSLGHDDPKYSVAYHDEGTAQRVRNAIRLHHVLETTVSSQVEALSSLEQLLLESGELLESEEFYSGLNNHGMFQSLALRDLASYCSWVHSDTRRRFLDQSNRQLFDYFDVAYTSEGVHIEHSPTYHLMVARDMAEHVRFLKRTGGDGTEQLEKILHKATGHSTHAILPNGLFFPFSDTQQLPLTHEANNITNSESFRYAASSGREGTRPESRTLCEPESGYFIHRSSWGDPESRFLAFTAAYNADYHKHSDDLHVYLWDNGHELLSESGPYGYGFQDPFVRYGFSQWAHNNVVVDGRSLPRTDGKYEAVKITEISEESGVWSVSGINTRFESVSHQRSIRLDDSISHLHVTDHLCADEEHKYTLNWNLGPTVQATIENSTVIGRINGEVAFVLSVDSDSEITIEHYRGELGRNPLGWKFPKMNEKIPSSLVSFTVTGKDIVLETSVAVLKPAGFGQGNTTGSLTPAPNRYSVAGRPQWSFKPIECSTFESSIALKSMDERIERAVVKLFSEQGEHSTLSGKVSGIRWDNLPNGRYRLRVFPKHEFLRYQPYTTEWFRIS